MTLRSNHPKLFFLFDKMSKLGRWKTFLVVLPGFFQPGLLYSSWINWKLSTWAMHFPRSCLWDSQLPVIHSPVVYFIAKVLGTLALAYGIRYKGLHILLHYWAMTGVGSEHLFLLQCLQPRSHCTEVLSQEGELKCSLNVYVIHNRKSFVLSSS